MCNKIISLYFNNVYSTYTLRGISLHYNFKKCSKKKHVKYKGARVKFKDIIKS